MVPPSDSSINHSLWRCQWGVRFTYMPHEPPTEICLLAWLFSMQLRLILRDSDSQQVGFKATDDYSKWHPPSHNGFSKRSSEENPLISVPGRRKEEGGRDIGRAGSQVNNNQKFHEKRWMAHHSYFFSFLHTPLKYIGQQIELPFFRRGTWLSLKGSDLPKDTQLVSSGFRTRTQVS